MPIIRIQKRENPYVQIDRAAIEDNRLSWKARGILAYLLSKPDDWSIHLFDIVNHGTEGRDSVQAAMQELRDLGYAKLETVRSASGKVAGKEWIITEQPTNGFSGCRLSPTNGITDVGKNRQSGNPLYSNNNKSSNNKLTARNSQTATASSSDIRRGAAAGYTFAEFWNDYGHKVGSKAKAKKAFAKLSEIDRGAIRDTLEAYKRATVTTDAGRATGAAFKPLRQHPLTYLNGRVWETYADSRAEAEQPTEYDEAYQKYVAWVEQNYPQAKRTCTNLSKTQFIEFKKTSVANIIGKESELKFLKTAHESAGEKDAWTIYQKLVNDRMEARRV